MSAIIETVNVEVVNEMVNTPVLEENKPLTYLPGKHGKFAVYLHWLLKKFNMHAPPALVQPTSDALIAITGMHTKDFAGQVAFYEEFFAAEKDAGKELREIVRALNKPVKAKAPPKDKVVKEPKEPKAVPVKEPKEPKEPKAVPVKVVKEKKPRKVKEVESVTNNDIIAQIVSRANSVDSAEVVPEVVPEVVTHEVVTPEVVTPEVIPQVEENIVKEKAPPKEKVVKEKVVKEKVVKEKAPPKEKVVKEKVVKEKAPPKEKVVKEKVVKEKAPPKEKAVKVVATVPVEPEKSIVTEELVMDIPTTNTVVENQDDDDDVELQVQLMTDENGLQYYIDDSGNRYSMDLEPL